MTHFTIVAHRGASGITPENTLTSFRKALDFGVDAIEIDVRQTADGKLIVLHDDDTGRTTSQSGSVSSMSYTELQKLDAGSWFDSSFKNERIPLFSDVIDLVKGKAGLIIEVKDGSQIYPNIEQNIVSLIQSQKISDDVVVSSSRITILNSFKSIATELRFAKILTPREYWRSLFQPGSYIVKQSLVKHIKELHPHWSFVDSQFIEWADSMKLTVLPWTVNKERKIRAMLDRGVAGVITDFPDRAHKIRSAE